MSTNDEIYNKKINFIISEIKELIVVYGKDAVSRIYVDKKLADEIRCNYDLYPALHSEIMQGTMFLNDETISASEFEISYYMDSSNFLQAKTLYKKYPLYVYY